jgi:hypothetical protein
MGTCHRFSFLFNVLPSNNDLVFFPIVVTLIEGDVARLLHLKPDVFKGFSADFGVHNVWQAVPDLDVLLDLAVNSRVRVVLVGQAPFVTRKRGAGLKRMRV